MNRRSFLGLLAGIPVALLVARDAVAGAVNTWAGSAGLKPPDKYTNVTGHSELDAAGLLTVYAAIPNGVKAVRYHIAQHEANEYRWRSFRFWDTCTNSQWGATQPCGPFDKTDVVSIDLSFDRTETLAHLNVET